MMANLVDASGEAWDGCPRAALRRAAARAAAQGLIFNIGCEPEGYIFREVDGRIDTVGLAEFASLDGLDLERDFMRDLLAMLDAMGVTVEQWSEEYGPGQIEINFAPSDGRTGADHAFIFKNAVKEIAQQRGYLASFMTKPYGDQSASRCHYHHSLLDTESGQNAFYDPNAADGLSAVARHWMAGQLAHSRALTALSAPTVNCAKRYKLYSFAPMNVSWGYEDRTAAIRVKGARDEATRLENRIPCAASNPYLVAAGMIAAGMDGLRRELEPPSPTTQTAYADEAAIKLPQTLDESLQALEEDRELRDVLGEEFIHLFLAVKRHEIAKARQALPEYDAAEWPNEVTEWERANLFEYL